MNFRNVATKVAPLVRAIHTSPRVYSGHGSNRGIFGSNVPFPVHNRYALLVVFMVYFSSGIALPFIAVRQMILSKNQE